jgi:hypothetical protein
MKRKRTVRDYDLAIRQHREEVRRRDVIAERARSQCLGDSYRAHNLMVAAIHHYAATFLADIIGREERVEKKRGKKK